MPAADQCVCNGAPPVSKLLAAVPTGLIPLVFTGAGTATGVFADPAAADVAASAAKLTVDAGTELPAMTCGRAAARGALASFGALPVLLLINCPVEPPTLSTSGPPPGGVVAGGGVDGAAGGRAIVVPGGARGAAVVGGGASGGVAVVAGTATGSGAVVVAGEGGVSREPPGSDPLDIDPPPPVASEATADPDLRACGLSTASPRDVGAGSRLAPGVGPA